MVVPSRAHDVSVPPPPYPFDPTSSINHAHMPVPGGRLLTLYEWLAEASGPQRPHSRSPPPPRPGPLLPAFARYNGGRLSRIELLLAKPGP